MELHGNVEKFLKFVENVQPRMPWGFRFVPWEYGRNNSKKIPNFFSKTKFTHLSQWSTSRYQNNPNHHHHVKLRLLLLRKERQKAQHPPLSSLSYKSTRNGQPNLSSNSGIHAKNDIHRGIIVINKFLTLSVHGETKFVAAKRETGLTRSASLIPARP